MKITDKITITNEDNMLLMARYPDNYFDLAIVDPPYGENCDINSKGNRTSSKNGFSKLYLEHTSKDWNVAPSQEYFEENYLFALALFITNKIYFNS